jgi:hypothetical protein
MRCDVALGRVGSLVFQKGQFYGGCSGKLSYSQKTSSARKTGADGLFDPTGGHIGFAVFAGSLKPVAREFPPWTTGPFLFPIIL